MKIRTFAVAPILAAGLVLVACSGGGSGDGSSTAGPGPVTPTKDSTAGVWKGSLSSTATGQTVPVVALTGNDGHTAWMAADGRVWHGEMPLSGDQFNSTLTGHMHDGAYFPDGTRHGVATMSVQHHAAGSIDGVHAGHGDSGSFAMTMSPMWERTASLAAVAGVYTRTTSNGYAMTMTIDALGQMTGSDSTGCVFSGTVTVPDPLHNLYGIDANVSSCGALDGHYDGMGALLDADAMRDWMTAMHPLEQGGHTHGGSMMGGPMGHNTVPSGQRNLFMFSLFGGQNAIMDALAR